MTEKIHTFETELEKTVPVINYFHLKNNQSSKETGPGKSSAVNRKVNSRYDQDQ